jgi:phytoene dehydrogenase-like protein
METSDAVPFFDVVVVGAGLAGLAAGATAARSGRRVLIVDGHSAGGRARTDERNGFRFNQGAHALYRGGHAECVLRELGVGMPAGASPSTDQWGVAGDVVSPLPFSAGKALRSTLLDSVGKAQLARFVFALRSVDPSTLADRSAEAWLTGLGLRTGATAILRTLAHVASYADDLTAISADAIAAQIKLAISHGVRYVDGGWQVLVDGLERAARQAGAEVRVRAPVKLVAAGESGTRVVLADGTEFSAGACVLALGSPGAASAVLHDPPHWERVGPPTTVACLDLGLRRVPPKRVVFGVGEPLYLSTHTPAADLAPPGRALVHLMRYGARDAATDRSELWALAHMAGIREDDVIEQRFLARMIVTSAIPVPGSGLAGRPGVDSVGIDGVYVAGDWVGPDGMLADAALASAAAAGTRAAHHAGAPGRTRVA